MNKPSLRDRRRMEAREALYRAQERREHLIAALVRNANHVTTLKRRLKHLDAPVGNTISPLPVSVAEGKVLARVTLKGGADPNDDISEISWREMTGADLRGED